MANGVASLPLLLALADDRLILGHRLSEWCAHAPILEEDIALANIALDSLGQATHLLRLAGTREGAGRNEDTLAFFRDAREFCNALLVEQPNGDFGQTLARQFLFDAFSLPLWERLTQSSDTELRAIAEKAQKETRYHLRHSSEWIRRLGDGTDESHRRVQSGVDAVWRFTEDLFAILQLPGAENVIPAPESLRGDWQHSIATIFAEATLHVPSDNAQITGGRQGIHSEHLGLLLAEMQIVARSHPGAEW